MALEWKFRYFPFSIGMLKFVAASFFAELYGHMHHKSEQQWYHAYSVCRVMNLF